MVGDRLAAVPLPQPHQSPQVSRAKAAAILSQHQFQAAKPTLFAQASRVIGRFLADLLSGGTGALVGWLILGAAVALVAVVLAIASRTLRGDPARPEPAVRVEVHRSATDWRQQAETFEAAGDWKEGLRCRYRALVADLIALHVVLDLPGRTTGEHRGDVGATLPAAGADFAGASELFERAWYGDRPTGPDQAARFAELSDAVVAQARRHRHGSAPGDGIGEGPGDGDPAGRHPVDLVAR
jgi:hypothetical protein